MARRAERDPDRPLVCLDETSKQLIVETRGSDRVVALMLLNLASLKDSYAPYAAEHAALYGRERSDG